MRYWLLFLSVAFCIYGFLRYQLAYNTEITKPNQLIVDQQECGCPCPDAVIIKGQLEIPEAIITKFPTLGTTQINLDIKNFNTPYNFELGHARLFLTGKVIGADTILCDRTNCELAARFAVDSWGLVSHIAKAWIFPGCLFFLFVVNSLLIVPMLLIAEMRRLLKNCSTNTRN